MTASQWMWLGPVLAFCGSVLLFAGAMVTLWWTNRAADRREWEKWRRETIIRLGSDAVVAAVDADTYYLEGRLAAAATATQRIYAIAEQLHLIGTKDLAEKCSLMADAADAARKVFANAGQASMLGGAAGSDVVPQLILDEPKAEHLDALTSLQQTRLDFVDAGHRELTSP